MMWHISMVHVSTGRGPAAVVLERDKQQQDKMITDNHTIVAEYHDNCGYILPEEEEEN